MSNDRRVKRIAWREPEKETEGSRFDRLERTVLGYNNRNNYCFIVKETK